MSSTIFFHIKYSTENKKTNKTYKLTNSLIFSFFILLFSANLNSQNLLTNGGFEGGGSGNGYLVNSCSFHNPTTDSNSSGSDATTTDSSLMNSSFISGDTIFTNLNWVTLPFLRFINLFKK